MAGAFALFSGLRPPRLARVEIALARWPRALDGFRIAQISDIHIGPLRDRRFARHLTERVNALAPDLIASPAISSTAARPAGRRGRAVRRAARAPRRVLRDRQPRPLLGRERLGRRDREARTRPAAQPPRHDRRDGASFTLAGVDDHRGGFGDGQREDLPRALAGVDPALPVVLLAHDPGTFKRASQSGVDLQLSGHTHGGQIWPFRWLVRLATPFVAGRYSRGGAELYVSRGTGFWGPPMRLFAPAEITELTLRGVEVD